MKIFNFKKEKRPARTNSKGACPTESFRRGFTLLEALVAVSILMVAVVAPITISQKGLSSAVYTKDHMLASYLAQDAMEYIKNYRDFLTINNNNDWDTIANSNFSPCLPDASGNTQYCQIDTIGEDNLGKIEPNVYNKLMTDPVNKFYGYGSNFTEETTFIRTISMTPAIYPPSTTKDDEILVKVIVSWGSDENNKVELNSLIYNY